MKAFLRSLIDFYFFQKIIFLTYHFFFLTFKSSKEKIIKDIRNLSRQEKEAKAIRDRILRDINNIFEHEEEQNYYKPARAKNFWSNNYIECESNSDRNKTLSVEEYLNKIKPY